MKKSHTHMLQIEMLGAATRVVIPRAQERVEAAAALAVRAHWLRSRDGLGMGGCVVFVAKSVVGLDCWGCWRMACKPCSRQCVLALVHDSQPSVEQPARLKHMFWDPLCP